MEGVCVCSGKDVLAELESCERKFLRPLAVESLILVREVGSTAYEALVVVLEEGHLILSETEFVPLLIDSLHLLEKVVVERHVHRVLCEHR